MKVKILFVVSLFILTISSVFCQSASDFKVSVDLSGEGVVIDKYLGKEKVIKIPSKIQGFPVLEIGEKAFFGSLVTSVTIPEGVIRIGYAAFAGCMDLTYINLPSTLKPGWDTIGDCSFEYCSKLPLPTQAALRKLGYKGKF